MFVKHRQKVGNEVADDLEIRQGAYGEIRRAMCRIWVLQASVGRPFSSMPHEPQTPMRHE